jgi:hypothetical protein
MQILLKRIHTFLDKYDMLNDSCVIGIEVFTCLGKNICVLCE